MHPNGASTFQRAQFFFGPTMFAGAISGNITNIYFYASGSSGASAVYYNFKVSLGTSTVDSLNTASWYSTGMVQCINSSSFTISGLGTGVWIKIPLTNPFYYENSKNLIIDIQSTGSSGFFYINQNTLTYSPGRVYGTVSIPSSSDAITPDFGIDLVPTYNDAGVLSIDSPYSVCLGSSNIFKTTIKNYGHNQINSVTVKWYFSITNLLYFNT